MRWGRTPQVGETRERVVFLWFPKRFYRRSSSFYFEDNGESVMLWLEKVYMVERWSYRSDQRGLGVMWGANHTNNTKCHWRTEAWRTTKEEKPKEEKEKKE